MLSKSEFQAILAAEVTLIIDGALATELEQRGHDLNHPLWSAKVLQDDPASIQDVHHDYYVAGATIAITASYQASVPGLIKHFDLSVTEAKKLIERSVDVARAARDAYTTSGDAHPAKRTSGPLLVAGSVGPYGAFLADGSEYRGDYTRNIDEFKNFHRARIAALVESGVDLLALETMPNLTEIRALLGLLQAEFPQAIAWIGCTMKDAAHLSDGSPWSDVLGIVNQHEDRIVSFGVNCVAMSSTADALQQIRSHTKLPLLCYPNSGEVWEAATHTWVSSKGARLDQFIHACQTIADLVSFAFVAWQTSRRTAFQPYSERRRRSESRVRVCKLACKWS